MKRKAAAGFWGFWDNIQGDRVIWIVVVMLMMFSIVSIFSSTTLLATAGHSRLDIFAEQMVIVAFGAAIIIGLYFIPKIGFFRFFSKFGFAVSLFFLIMLFTPLKETINGATRSFRLFGFSIQSYEVVKVSMVMYLSWAVYSYRNNLFRHGKNLPDWGRRLLYIYAPMGIVCGLILVGSFSSAAFIGLIMLLTIIIGGGTTLKDILIITAIMTMFGAGFLGINSLTDYRLLPRQKTWEQRFMEYLGKGSTSTLDEYRPGSAEYMKIIDKMRQPEGAMIAIHEGGLFGKGAGRSTQKYAVSLIFSDFMFSFIIEEFGLFAAIILIILYVSLLARGSIIVRNCENDFAKTAVAGLCLLISGQAMMHMYINVGLGPLTGQTLPMISHGNASFLSFSIAFGVLLSISKMAKKKVEQEAEMAGPLVVEDDDIKAGLDDLDRLDSME